jgi:hypothetical protein
MSFPSRRGHRGPGGGVTCDRPGQARYENGATVHTGPAGELEVTTVPAGELAGQRQTDAVGPPVVHRRGVALLEQLVHSLGGNAVAAVHDDEVQVVGLSDNGEFHPGGDSASATGATGRVRYGRASPGRSN